MKEETQTQSLRGKLSSGLSSLALVIAVVLCLTVVVQVTTNGYVQIGGYSLFRVITGSMEPEIPVNSLLICKKTEPLRHTKYVYCELRCLCLLLYSTTV